MDSGNLDEQLLNKSRRKDNLMNTSSLNINNLEKSDTFSNQDKKVNYISAQRLINHNFNRLSYESLLINDMNIMPIREDSKEHEMSAVRETFCEADHPSQSEDTVQMQYKSPDSLVHQNPTAAVNASGEESDSYSENTEKNAGGQYGAFEKQRTS